MRLILTTCLAAVLLGCLASSVLAAPGDAAKRACTRAQGRQAILASNLPKLTKDLAASTAVLPNPVSVICGDLTRDGAAEMVTLIAISETQIAGWQAWQWRGRAWRLIGSADATYTQLVQGGLQAATRLLFKPDDARCCPSGGTVMGRWTWNGSKMTLVKRWVVPPN